MIEGWLRHAELTAKSKGLMPSLAIWIVLAAIASAAALIFLSIAAFIWVTRLYDDLTAALALTGAYLLIAIASIVIFVVVRKHAIQKARAELAARARTPPLWQDPRILAAGIEIGRMIGWKRTVPLAALGMFAAGIAHEWSNHAQGKNQDRN